MKTKRRKKCPCCVCCGDDRFFNRVWSTYDHKFLGMLILVYFNQTLRLMIGLTMKYILMVKNELEPSVAQPMIANVLLPFSLKFILGIISDSLPICGSTRRSYLYIFAVIQLVASIISTIFINDDYMVACICGFFIGLSMSFMDVVVDGMLVNQQKLDLKKGSSDL